ncbi:MAG: neprosin family prolyl endopeptidase [Catenulispora sp.]
MPISRRSVIAAGLAAVVAGTVGFLSTTAAGASQTPATPGHVTIPAPPGGDLAAKSMTARTAASAGRYAPKGHPPTAGGTAPGFHANIAASSYLYGVARQSVVSDGSYGTMTVGAPKLDSDDFHTLGELAAQSADGSQIVEIGWTVDRSINGDDSPHLFVYHWVDGVGSCYNGCGFVQYNPSLAKPGTALVANTQMFFAIEHYQNGWWIMAGTEWIGYFPDTLWGGRFTKTGLAQWFGEVAASSDSPCTDMGTGVFANNAAAATVVGIGYFNGPDVNLSLDATDKSLYTTKRFGANGFRFGGPGAC